MTDHIVDPSTILTNSLVTWLCPVPDCGFTVRKKWQTPDGRAFGDRICYMHEPRQVMLITEVVPPTE